MTESTEHEMIVWLRAAIEHRKANAEAVPEEPPWGATDDRDDFSGDALVGYVTLRSADGTPMADDLRGHISGEGLRHIALNDPRDVTIRCESELEILGAYEAAVARDKAEWKDYSDWLEGKSPSDPKQWPTFTGPDPKLIPGLRRAVELLDESYRHFPGWKEEWR